MTRKRAERSFKRGTKPVDQRVFRMTADEVAREVPAYGAFVAEQVARLGRKHPTVRTQYFSEEIDAEAGCSRRERMALMEGGHAWQERPAAGRDLRFPAGRGRGGRRARAQTPGEARARRDRAGDRGGGARQPEPTRRCARRPTRWCNLRQWRG